MTTLFFSGAIVFVIYWIFIRQHSNEDYGDGGSDDDDDDDGGGGQDNDKSKMPNSPQKKKIDKKDEILV